MPNQFIFTNQIQLQPQITHKVKHNHSATPSQTFDHVLTQKIDQLHFSQHALSRMQSRNIELKADDVQKLNDAVNKIAQKGAKESLLLYNQIAFVVSVPNKTVITAMDQQSMKNNVFTQIDSAMIL